MTEMMAEELQCMAELNKKLSEAGLKSKLSYLYVSGIREGIVTEWGFEEEIIEAAAANILVSEQVRKFGYHE
ncbi:hypothetical protein [Nitrososphaera sp.]|uniref:hypothetical protein n=1 Tax=Nitrososphaera sp. TaxID=1971748 RepID=UPI002ED7DF52